MKAERETLTISDATSLFSVIDKIMSSIQDVVELEDMLLTLHKLVNHYRCWIAYGKPSWEFPNIHQGFYAKKKIWVIKFQTISQKDNKGES